MTALRLKISEDSWLPTKGPGLQPINGNFAITSFTVVAVPKVAIIAALGIGIVANLRRRR